MLYLGCNVLRNSDMVRTVTDVLDLLGVDYVAVGGPAYCCGIVQHRQGDEGRAQHMGAQTISFLQRYQPREVILWCPSCTFLLRRDLPGPDALPATARHGISRRSHRPIPLRHGRALPRRHALSQRPATAPPRTRRRPALAPGCARCDQPGDRQRRRARHDLLTPTRGRPTLPAQHPRPTPSRRGWWADTFATIYHGCQRLICAFEEESPLSVVHVPRLFARALGIEYEDTYKKYRLWRDPARVVEDLAPCMQAQGIDPGRAQALVERYLPAVDA